MKAINILFGIIGTFFLLFGLAFLFISEPTQQTDYFFFICFFCGLVCITFFLVTDHVINSKK